MSTQDPMPGIPQLTLADALQLEIRATTREIEDIQGKLQVSQKKTEDRVSLLERRLATLQRTLEDVKARGWALPETTPTP